MTANGHKVISVRHAARRSLALQCPGLNQKMEDEPVVSRSGGPLTPRADTGTATTGSAEPRPPNTNNASGGGRGCAEPQPIGKLLPKRKHPAHPTPVEKHNEPIIIFVTLCAKPRGDFFANEQVYTAFHCACEDADAWRVGRYVIMPDHIHLFCGPDRWPPYPLKRWTAYLKERITKKLNAMMEDEAATSETGSPQVRPPRDWNRPRLWRWQTDMWDTQMRNGRHYSEKWAYVRQNPVRAGLVGSPDEWPWQGAVHALRW